MKTVLAIASLLSIGCAAMPPNPPINIPPGCAVTWVKGGTYHVWGEDRAHIADESCKSVGGIYNLSQGNEP